MTRMRKRIRRAIRRTVFIQFIGLLGFLFWWWLLRRPGGQAHPVREKASGEVSGQPRQIVLPAAEPQPAPKKPVSKPKPKPRTKKKPPTSPAPADDLKRIEGIGPKTAAALQGAGVRTFAQLAAMSVEDVQDLLRQAGVRVGVSETWMAQAGSLAKEK